MSIVNSEGKTYAIPIRFSGLDRNMKIRLYADIAKDLAVKASPTLTPGDIDTIIATLYTDSAITKNSGSAVKYGTNYDTLIKDITNELIDSAGLSRNITTLKNVMRSNGVSSNIRISNASHVFYESGDSPKSVCIRAEITQISTPASILDTAGKVAGNSTFYPEENKQLIFDSEFLQKCGFPTGMRWEYNSSTKRVKIVYSSPPEVAINSGIGISQPLRGDFEPYSQGNVEKNTEIARLKKNMKDNKTEMNVILMTKEFADVAQVLVYYAYVVEQEAKGAFNRASVVMITTDSVVYYLCLALNLSCIYTGARVGVTSGGCNLSYFEAGTPDYLSQLKSIILNEYNDINACNYSMITSYNTVIADFSLIRFIDDGSVVRLTGTATPSTNSGKIIIEQIRWIIAAIQDVNDQLKAFYDSENGKLNEIDGQITTEYLQTTYETFRAKAREFKMPPEITRTKIDRLNNYIISNETLIQSFKTAAATITRSTRSRGSSRKGGQRGGVCDQSNCDDVEFLKIVIFIWHQWCNTVGLSNELNTDTIARSVNEDYNKTLFIIYYELYAYEPFNDGDFEEFIKNLESVADEDILLLGNLIINQSGMDLAPDDSVEKIIADYKLYKDYLEKAVDTSEWTGRTKRGGVAVFAPETGCDGKDDLILVIWDAKPVSIGANGITAKFNNPMNDNKKDGICFDVMSIIKYTLQYHDWYLKNIGARDIYELETVLSSFWIPYRKPDGGEEISKFTVKVLPETAAKINIFINSRIPHEAPETERKGGRPKTRVKSKKYEKKNKRRNPKKTRKRK